MPSRSIHKSVVADAHPVGGGGVAQCGFIVFPPLAAFAISHPFSPCPSFPLSASPPFPWPLPKTSGIPRPVTNRPAVKIVAVRIAEIILVIVISKLGTV